MKPYTYNHNDFNPCNMFAAVRGCGCDLPFRNLTDPQVDPQAPALPGIYGDWAATVEETSVTKNTTISRREIFSFTHKKLRMDWGTGLDKHAMIEDFADGKKFLIVKNATYATPKCIVMDKNDRSDTNYYLDGESELRPTEYLMGYNATEERYVTGEHSEGLQRTSGTTSLTLARASGTSSTPLQRMTTTTACTTTGPRYARRPVLVASSRGRWQGSRSPGGTTPSAG